MIEELFLSQSKVSHILQQCLNNFPAQTWQILFGEISRLEMTWWGLENIIMAEEKEKSEVADSTSVEISQDILPVPVGGVEFES